MSSELAIYPCREDGTGKWFFEVTNRETGSTLFISDPSRSRASALRKARKQIEALAKEALRGVQPVIVEPRRKAK